LSNAFVRSIAILRVSKPSISQRSQIKEDNVELSVRICIHHKMVAMKHEKLEKKIRKLN